MTTSDYISSNRRELERMRALVTRLDDKQLQRQVNADWTVAALLGHLAFWDARNLSLIDKWESGRAQPSHADWEPEDVHWINDAARELIHAVPPRRCAELALSIASETDRRVEQLSPALLQANTAAGSPLNPSRADHRREHLDDIEAALSPSPVNGGGSAGSHAGGSAPAWVP